jgi:TPR repeat protein
VESTSRNSRQRRDIGCDRNAVFDAVSLDRIGAVAEVEKACSGGDPSMCNNLGVCYHKGECGLAKDDTRAAQLYRKACRGGDSSACHNLDVMKN